MPDFINTLFRERDGYLLSLDLDRSNDDFLKGYMTEGFKTRKSRNNKCGDFQRGIKHSKLKPGRKYKVVIGDPWVFKARYLGTVETVLGDELKKYFNLRGWFDSSIRKEYLVFEQDSEFLIYDDKQTSVLRRTLY